MRVIVHYFNPIQMTLNPSCCNFHPLISLVPYVVFIHTCEVEVGQFRTFPRMREFGFQWSQALKLHWKVPLSSIPKCRRPTCLGANHFVSLFHNSGGPHHLGILLKFKILWLAQTFVHSWALYSKGKAHESQDFYSQSRAT